MIDSTSPHVNVFSSHVNVNLLLFRHLYSKASSSSSSTSNAKINPPAAVTGSEATIASLTSQLNEASHKLTEVEKRNKLLSGDQDALSSTSLEQCDELILTLTRSQEKIQQRRVSNYPTIFAYHI